MGSVYARLCMMMFIQYYVWGSWGVAIGGYMDQKLKFTGAQQGSIFGTTAIAAILSPFLVGYIADRLFATERLLAVLHLVGGGLLWYASTLTSYEQLFPTMIAYALCYMPTLALTNSISFENIKDPEKEFPLIRVFGTFGWIGANWVVGAMHWDQSQNILVMASCSSVVLGLFSLLLPHTPPKSKESHAAGREGLLHLLREPSFVVFLVASFVLCIPLSFYYTLCNVFLSQCDYPYPAVLQTLGQISEVFFMAAMPLFVAWLGIKRMLAVGMLAWVVRYLFFGSMSFPLVIVGLILHGVCYDFYFVASYIYVDKKAEVSQRARAQSFFAIITLGLGMFVGSNASGWTKDYFHPPRVTTTAADGSSSQQPLPDWDPTGKTGFAQELGLAADGRLTAAAVEAKYAGLPMKTTLEEAIQVADEDRNGEVTREEWRRAQRNDWPSIWFLAAGLAGATLVFFWFGFHDRSAERQAAAAA
ncbi:MAG: MFS transporter [Pirellulales bacterium]|nr:MFS transporter [Pirellulales bacterium]